MKTGDINAAYECPTNEGAEAFRVGVKSCGYKWTTGQIEIELRGVGNRYIMGSGVDQVHREEFVVVYDTDGNKRVEFPRRNAFLEYHVEEVGA